VESEGVVRIYDLETYLAHHVFYGEFAAISPEGQTMALLNFGQFKTYSISDEQLLNTFEGDFSGIDEAILQFSHDGKWLAGYSIQNFCCLGKDESLSLWRVSDGKLIKKFEQPSALFNFSPTNNNLAITLRLGGTYIFNADDASQIAEVGMYNSQVTSVSFYSTGHDLVVATAENNSSQYYDFPGDYQPPLFFYDVDSGILFNNQPATMYNVPVALSTDGKIYAPDDLRDLPSIKELENIGSIAFSPDGKKVAIGATNGLFIWDIPSKTLLLHGGVGQYTSIDFSPDGQKVATARVNEGIMSHEEGTTISIWEAIHGGNRLTDLVPGLGVNTVSYSPDGRFIAAGGKDGVTVWSIPGANILFRINNGIKGYSPIGALGIQRMAFSPDSRIFAVGFVDGTIQLWDTNRVRRIITLKVTDTPFNSINDLDFSSDGKLLAAGLEDGSVRIFGIK
jgi:WD40 repeat protein